MPRFDSLRQACAAFSRVRVLEGMRAANERNAALVWGPSMARLLDRTSRAADYLHARVMRADCSCPMSLRERRDHSIACPVGVRHAA